jgi:hypothetical protein
MRGKDFKYDDVEKKALVDGIIFTIMLLAAGYLVYKVLANLSYIESLIA